MRNTCFRYDIDLHDHVLQRSRITLVLFNQREIIRNLMTGLFESGMRNRAHILFINRFESLILSSRCAAKDLENSRALRAVVSQLAAHTRA